MTATIIAFPKRISRNMEDLLFINESNIRAVVRSTYDDKPPAAVFAGEEAAITAIKAGKTFMQAMSIAGDKVRELTAKCLNNVLRMPK